MKAGRSRYLSKKRAIALVAVVAVVTGVASTSLYHYETSKTTSYLYLPIPEGAKFVIGKGKATEIAPPD